MVVDGCPPGLAITTEDIQKELDRRRPGQSAITTPRAEKDKVEILSGVFDGLTTGTPIALLIRNEDKKSEDYEQLEGAHPSRARRLDLRREVRRAGLAGQRPRLGPRDRRARGRGRHGEEDPRRSRRLPPGLQPGDRRGARAADRSRGDRAQPGPLPGSRGRAAHDRADREGEGGR